MTQAPTQGKDYVPSKHKTVTFVTPPLDRNESDQCGRCKSFWGKAWAICQRCGFASTMRELGQNVAKKVGKR